MITPLISSRVDDKWTDLQKQAILHILGLRASTDWNHVARQPIWDMYASEGRTVEAVQRVLAQKVAEPARAPDTDEPR
jgi:hypothetical protein